MYGGGYSHGGGHLFKGGHSQGYSPYMPHPGEFRVMPAQIIQAFRPSPPSSPTGYLPPPPPTFHDVNTLSGEIGDHTPLQSPPIHSPPSRPVLFPGSVSGAVGASGCNCVHLVECLSVLHQDVSPFAKIRYRIKVYVKLF